MSPELQQPPVLEAAATAALNAPPAPPAHLSEAAQAMWIRITEENGIDNAAVPILTTLCEAWDRREQARVAIAADGAVYKDRFNAPKISPWMAIERDMTLILHRAFRLLGFDQEPRGQADQGKLF